MPTTTNFGWTTPADTDLVKDGAAAIRTLGNGIDTSFLDLKGGTTSQILSKASATDLDFTWVAGGDRVAFTPTLTNITLGNGTNTAHYVQINKFVFVEGKITFGSTTSITGLPKATLPVTAAIAGESVMTNCHYADFGTTGYVGFVYFDSTTTVSFYVQNVGSTYPTFTSLSSTVPHTWAVNDYISYRYSFEAA